MVLHVLKDGTVLHDIDGHVVKVNDARFIYSLIDKMNQRTTRQKGDEKHG